MQLVTWQGVGAPGHTLTIEDVAMYTRPLGGIRDFSQGFRLATYFWAGVSGHSWVVQVVTWQGPGVHGHPCSIEDVAMYTMPLVGFPVFSWGLPPVTLAGFSGHFWCWHPVTWFLADIHGHS